MTRKLHPSPLQSERLSSSGIQYATAHISVAHIHHRHYYWAAENTAFKWCCGNTGLLKVKLMPFAAFIRLAKFGLSNCYTPQKNRKEKPYVAYQKECTCATHTPTQFLAAATSPYWFGRP